MDEHPKYDIVLQVVFNVENPEKTVIKTNAKKEAIEGILEAWISGQLGQGKDESEANQKSEYNIEIKLDLSRDVFYTKSDTGNEGLTCGIIMTVFRMLDKITILDLGEAQGGKMPGNNSNLVFCDRCKEETGHRHLHDSAYGIEETHIAGSERYECVKCKNEIYKKEGVEKGLKFILD